MNEEKKTTKPEKVEDVAGALKKVQKDRARRLLCRLFGHRLVWVDAEPVSSFWCCKRCGKFGR